MTTRFMVLVNFLILFSFLAGCGAPAGDELILNDFETDADLDRLHWKCHALYSLSNEHSTRGSKSLRMELYPSEYPGLAPALAQNDWRGYTAFCFDVYNPGLKEVRLTLRIDDYKDAFNYADRYNQTITLKPGENRVVQELSSLKTSGTKRQLDLKRIYQFLMFVVRPEEKTILYVDNIRLVK